MVFKQSHIISELFFSVLKFDFLRVLSPRPLKRGGTAECAALISLCWDCEGCRSRLLEESCRLCVEGSSEESRTELKVMLGVSGAVGAVLGHRLAIFRLATVCSLPSVSSHLFLCSIAIFCNSVGGLCMLRNTTGLFCYSVLFFLNVC